MESENFTKVPNEIIEGIASSRSFCARARVMAVVIRKTYGWNKKEDWISLSQFQSITGIEKSNICRTLNQLVKAKIIIKSDNKYQINSITKAWKELSNTIKIITSDKAHYQNGQLGLLDLTPTKDTLTKNNLLQKKDKSVLMLEQDFENFWQEYPKKVGKKKACTSFLKLKKDLLPIILEALKKQKSSAAWEENGGQFIPHPATWINGERWEDDVQTQHFNNFNYGKNQRSGLAGYVSKEGYADLVVGDDD